MGEIATSTPVRIKVVILPRSVGIGLSFTVKFTRNLLICHYDVFTKHSHGVDAGV